MKKGDDMRRRDLKQVHLDAFVSDLSKMSIPVSNFFFVMYNEYLEMAVWVTASLNRVIPGY